MPCASTFLSSCGVRPYKISTIVDVELRQRFDDCGVRPYKISTIVDTMAFACLLSGGVRPYKISTIVIVEEWM